jgi:polar amino acid transport system substrate-binding protein
LNEDRSVNFSNKRRRKEENMFKLTSIVKIGIVASVVLFLLVPIFSAAADVDLADVVKGSNLTKIRERGVLRVGCDATYPPFDMVDKDGNVFGMDVDIGKSMAEIMGVKHEVVNTAWEGIIPALQTGKFDIIINGMTPTAKRGLAVAFSQPYFTHGQTLGVNQKRSPGIKGWKDLDKKGKIIAVMLGTSGDFLATRLYKSAEIRRFQTAPEMVLEVVAGRADAWQWDTPQTAFHVGRNKDKVYTMDIPTTEYFEHSAFGIRMGDPVFLTWLNLFIMEMKDSGKYNELYKKWFTNTDWWLKLLPPEKAK